MLVLRPANRQRHYPPGNGPGSADCSRAGGIEHLGDEPSPLQMTDKRSITTDDHALIVPNGNFARSE